MTEPEYAVFVGLDVGDEEHHACGLDLDGNRVHDKGSPAARTYAVVWVGGEPSGIDAVCHGVQGWWEHRYPYRDQHDAGLLDLGNVGARQQQDQVT